MTWKISIPLQELCCSRVLFNLLQRPKRNLGCAILVDAIDDYRGTDDQAHASAAIFLYPATPEYQEHYDWVVAMAPGVNPAWLRDALDKSRESWNQERAHRKMRALLDSALRKIEARSAGAYTDHAPWDNGGHPLSHPVEATSMRAIAKSVGSHR